MSDGLCQCGCGQPAPIAKRTVASRGRFKGQPMRFVRGHNSVGMNRSKPYKLVRYIEEDRGYKTPCWIWQLKIGRNGYGTTRVEGKDTLAHRWYYEQARGPIAPGLQLDHLCTIRNCVNPDHLEAVTPLENSRRSRATKLSQERAAMIRDLVAAGHGIRAVARAFGVSHATVALLRDSEPHEPRRPRMTASELAG